MAQVELRKVGKRYGGAGATPVLAGLDLRIEAGELMVFLGPSGCGKTTLLRMICGLEPITEGALLIDGRHANDLAPVERRVALVFQSYALYPHMSVRENLAFGLRLTRRRTGLTAADIARRVREVAQLLQIGELLDRKPRALSGGQRQRVAIGRALVREPALLLMDEPLSNLDAALRAQMRLELIELHRRLGNTTVYVTHDQVEAMTLADRMAILNAGNIVQVGRPLEVYHRPATQFVASFIGSPRMNFLEGRLAAGSGDAPRVAFSETLALAADVEVPAGIGEGAEVTLGLRPEDLRLTDPAPGLLQGRVHVVEPLGEATLVHVRLATPPGATVVVRAHGTVALATGTPVGLAAEPRSVHLFDAEGRAMRRRCVPELGAPATRPVPLH